MRRNKLNLQIYNIGEMSEERIARDMVFLLYLLFQAQNRY